MRVVTEAGENTRVAVMCISEHTVIAWYTLNNIHKIKAIDVTELGINSIVETHNFAGDLEFVNINKETGEKEKWVMSLGESDADDFVMLKQRSKDTVEVTSDIKYTLKVSEETIISDMFKLMHNISQNCIEPKDSIHTTENTTGDNRLHIQVLKDSVIIATNLYNYTLREGGNTTIELKVKNIQDERYSEENTETIQNIKYDDFVNFIRHIILI